MVQKGTYTEFLKSGIDFGSLLKKGMRMLNPLRFQELPPWGIAPFPSLQFGLNSLPDPPWKRPLRRAKTWVLILQHARVCRSWWPHGPSVCSVYDISLFQRGHQISSALFHGIDRIKTACREPAWFGFSFWCRMETSPGCTAMTHMHDVCGIDWQWNSWCYHS